MSKVLKVSGNIVTSNVNNQIGSNLSSKTLKIKTLNSGNLSLFGDPTYNGFSKTLKIPGCLSDQNSFGISVRPYWSSYNSAPINYNNDKTFNINGINNNGNMVGNITNVIYYVPSMNDTKISMNLGAYSGGYVYSINDNGIIVGTCQNRPCYWSSYTAAPITMNYTGTGGIATSINNSGAIVGKVSTSGSLTAGRPAYWSSNVATPVTLSTYTCSFVSINNSGNIVTSLTDQNSIKYPTYWSSNVATPVSINTGTFNSEYCTITGINDQGNIIGTFTSPNTSFIPLFWESYTSDPVVMCSGSYISNFLPFGINNLGTIV